MFGGIVQGSDLELAVEGDDNVGDPVQYRRLVLQLVLPLLLFFNIHQAADITHEGLIVQEPWHARIEHPAIAAIFFAQAIGRTDPLPFLEAGFKILPCPLPVIRVDEGAPAAGIFSYAVHAGKGLPHFTGVDHFLTCVAHPDHDRGDVRQPPEPVLAFT